MTPQVILCRFEDGICVGYYVVGVSTNTSTGVSFVYRAKNDASVAIFIFGKHFNPEGYNIGSLKIFEEGVLALINDKNG